MNKKSLIIMLATTLFLSACASKKPNLPTVSNMEDVKYNIDENGSISLEKQHGYSDGNKSTEVEKISSSSQNLDAKGYEIVPNFEKKHANSLSLDKSKEKEEKKITVVGSDVKVSVESIPVNEFIDLMFSNILKLNYTVSEDVKSLKTPITLNMVTVQPKQEVLDVVIKLLSLNGVKVKQENGIVFLSKGESDKSGITSENMYIGYGRVLQTKIPDDEDIIMFVPFEHIDPKKSVYILKLAGISNSIFYYPSKNIMMIKNRASEVRRSLEVIKLIDRPYMEGKTPYLVELKNIEVEEFTKRLKSILEANAVPVIFSPVEDGLLLSTIPELNSLLVISPKKSWMDMVLYWKTKLDVISKISAEPKFYTYKVKNRKADELAEALNSVVDIKLSGVTQVKTTKNKEIKKESSLVKSDHTIKADLTTNILMMQLLPSEYRELLPLIEQLDALPLQVLVEVTLAEVTLTDSFSLGFEYALRNDIASQGSSLLGTTVTAALGGSGFSAIYNSKNLDATINAYASNELLSIMSKPKLLILNNQTGNINVGTEVPIITSESSASDISTTSDASILRNVTYRSTGIIVGLTPTINSNGILTMNITLQLSEAQLNDTSDISSPLIINRSVSTSLTLKHGETVMIGGLISKNKSTTDTGVPLLMDIPWLGTLFTSNSDKTVKTELIMLIKPFIIETPTLMNEKTKQYKLLLKLLNQYSLF